MYKKKFIAVISSYTGSIIPLFGESIEKKWSRSVKRANKYSKSASGSATGGIIDY
jgi:hypothetical protein